jgi:DNA mismatch repair protein MLH3
MPVRVKQRPTAGDRGVVEKEWTRLCRDVVALSLPWRSAIAISLRETVTRHELRLRPGQDQTLPGPRQRSPGSTLCRKVSRALIQAHLADSCNASSWERVSGSSEALRVRGCISLSPTAMRRSQFVCIGIQPIPTAASEVYDELNRVFANSTFAVADEDSESPQKSGAGVGARNKRSVDRWPMFYFQVEARQRARNQKKEPIEQILDERYRLEPVVDLLKEVCYSFLKRHHCSPRELFPPGTSRQKRTVGKGKEKSSSNATSPGKNGLNPAGVSPFDAWNRIKRGRPLDIPVEPNSSASPTSTGGKREKIISDSGSLLRAPFLDVPGFGRMNKKYIQHSTLDTCQEDPSHANLNAVCPHTASAVGPDEPLVIRAPTPAQPGLSTGRVSISSQPGKKSEWVANILKTWENPVFKPTEMPVRTAPQSYEISKHSGHRCAVSSATSTPSPLLGRIHRGALKQAVVTGQVDKKFILAKLPLDIPGKTDIPYTAAGDAALLVVIDQHAADERCRIEELMQSYFHAGVSVTEPLPTAINFEVSLREGILFRRFQAHFAYWGIFYTHAEAVSSPRSGDGGFSTPTPSASHVRVTSLPPSILERCRQEPRLLIDLLRDEAHALEDRGGGGSSGPPTAPAPGDWVAAFGGCPRGILDLLNSRACRGAVMFNDELSVEECDGLLGRLSRCAFPFQCAHGRPSMVPLVDVGLLGTWGESKAEDGVLWERWLESKENG